MSDSVAPAIVSDEAVVAPPPTKEVPQDVPAPQPDEDAEKPEVEAEAETEEQEPPEPPGEEHKPRSGYARLKARHQALIAENERLRNQQTSQGETKAEEKPPTLEEFNGDYLAFEKASVAFAAKAAVREEMSRQREAETQAKQAETQHEIYDEFFEKAEAAKAKIPGFDQSIDALYGQLGPLPTYLRDMIASADNGPQILYYMSQNPGYAREVYGYGPIDAAMEIGKLEAKMSLPSAKKETKAPPPITSPKGGAAPPSDIFKLAAKSDDISDYVRARQKEKKD